MSESRLEEVELLLEADGLGLRPSGFSVVPYCDLSGRKDFFGLERREAECGILIALRVDSNGCVR